MRIINVIKFCLLCIPLMALAQQKQGHVMRPISKGIGHPSVIGYAQVEVMYALNAIDISDENSYIDLHVLRIGKGISKQYSRFVELNDSLFDDFNRRNPNARSRPVFFCIKGRNSNYWSEYQFTDIYTENGLHTLYAWMPRYLERYNGYYTEPAHGQKWTLHEEQDSVLGYNCQRATCHWRGRDYEAWFAVDIPVGLGPWIFGGLPGLIMKIHDKDHLYTWEAVSMRLGNFPITIRKYDGFRKESREHIHKLQVEVNRDYSKVGGARDPKTGQLISKVTPYEPLELE